jgi:hypothetical protein
VTHVFESHNEFGHDFGRTSASLDPGSNLDIRDGGRPNVIRYYGADTPLKKLFPILGTVSTTTVWTTPRQGAQTQ